MYIFNIFKKNIGQILIPTFFVFIPVILVWKWPDILSFIDTPEKARSIINLLPSFPYFILLISIAMGWRYNNTGLILSSFILIVAFLGIRLINQQNETLLVATIMFLLPLNIVSFSLIDKKHFFSAIGITCILIIILQIFTVIYMHMISTGIHVQKSEFEIFNKFFTLKPSDRLSIHLNNFFLNKSFLGIKNISGPAIFSNFFAIIFLCVLYIVKKNMIYVGYIGSIITALMGLSSSKLIPDASIFFIFSGLLLIFSKIETSHLKSYIDELTGLPGRRALNETLVNLGRKYTIAMMDIDHFKKFNDTYGHKTGDEVLKMVAVKLSNTTGGAKTFRYGGEEFTAIFRGKIIDDTLPHLEKLRQTIENSPFVVRSKSRNKANKSAKGSSTKKTVHVTVSIGVASPNKANSTPELVIKSADKALYKAKKAGRNCISS